MRRKPGGGGAAKLHLDSLRSPYRLARHAAYSNRRLQQNFFAARGTTIGRYWWSGTVPRRSTPLFPSHRHGLHYDIRRRLAARRRPRLAVSIHTCATNESTYVTNPWIPRSACISYREVCRCIEQFRTTDIAYNTIFRLGATLRGRNRAILPILI